MQPGPAPVGARHCWLTDPPGEPGRWPGLVVEWRRGDLGWEGRVAYGVPGTVGAIRLIEQWLPASHLRPAASTVVTTTPKTARTVCRAT